MNNSGEQLKQDKISETFQELQQYQQTLQTLDLQELTQLTPLELEVSTELSEELEKAAHEEISQLEQQLQLNRNEQQDVKTSRTMLDMTALGRANESRPQSFWLAQREKAQEKLAQARRNIDHFR